MASTLVATQGQDVNVTPEAVQTVAPGTCGLPAGLPAAVGSEQAWAGSDFACQDQYTLHLTPEHISELDGALRGFKELGLDGDAVCKDNFPLPTLSRLLGAMKDEIYSGRGFGLIRGVDPDKHSIEDLTILQLGMQAYIANQMGRQDKKGNMLVHIVADSSSATRANHHRHSKAPITFHNEEAGDIVSWLTRSTASTGGRCIIASACTVFNVLAETRPDMIRTLMRSDWPFALPRFHCRPILFHHEGRLIMNFGRAALIGSPSHPRPADLPSLTPRQMEALDAVETISQATQLSMQTKPGDIHMINNLVVMHRREGFTDGEEAKERRHLVRMRLRDDEMGWSIPAELQDEWRRAFGAHQSTMWHLEPMPEGFFPLRGLAN